MNKRTYTSNQIHTYPENEKFWSLFDASLWVGCKGQELNTDGIERDGLDDIGAMTLFKALHTSDALKATGINLGLLREEIPSEFWELAKVNPDEEQGHHVDFIDDAAEGFWGTLTPYGDGTPRWNRIQVEAKLLKRLFPAGKPEPKSCQHWLESEMQNSPHERPMTKDEYLKESLMRFKITEADFKRVWRKALENTPEAQPFWTKGGRPKNP